MLTSNILNMDGPAAKRSKMDINSSITSQQSKENEKCFICDSTIVGKKYSLASCMTNGTKVRLVEVLGRLVCDNYMVVVSHMDYICRGCANLLNTLDRLEAEISSVKRIVLNFVERKYRLGDKLQIGLTPTPVTYSKTSTPNNVATQNAVPTVPVSAPNVIRSPQVQTPVSTQSKRKQTFPPSPPKKVEITPAKPADTSVTSIKKSLTKPETPVQPSAAMRTKSYKITLKDEQILGQSPGLLQSAEEKVLSKIAPGGSQATMPKNVWMQCNQCQYTTNQRAVMLEHLRQHVASRNTSSKAKDAGSTSKSQDTKTVTSTQVTTTTTSTSNAMPSTSDSSSSAELPVVSKAPAVSNNTKNTVKETSSIEVNKTPQRKLTQLGAGQQAIIVRKVPNPGVGFTSPGIVTKMLAGSKIVSIQKSLTSQSAMTDSAKKIISNAETTISKIVVASPQVFSSSTKNVTQPEPSLPLLFGEEDL